jgi:hypothetical protein
MPEPIAADAQGGGFETIAIVYSFPEAAMLLAALRAHFIVALPRHYGHISVKPTLMVALGGIRITVPPAQVADALASMEEIDQGWERPPRPYTDTAWLSILLSIALTFMLGIPPMPRAPGWYRWHAARAKDWSPNETS